MELPPSFVTITSPTPDKGKGDSEASSPESRASPPVRVQNLRECAGDVSLPFLQSNAGLLPTITFSASSASTENRPSSASANNVTATGSVASMEDWLKNQPKSSDDRLQLTTGQELEECVSGIERNLRKLLSNTTSIQERTKVIESLLRTHGSQVIEHLESLLTKQTEGNETLDSIKTQQTIDSATLSSMAANQNTMVTQQGSMATQQAKNSEILDQILQLLLTKEGTNTTDVAATAAAATTTAAVATLLPEVGEKATAGAIQRERAERIKAQKEVVRLRTEREKAQQVTKFLSNHKTASQILADMGNDPPMPAQQKESLAKHQHRMHPKTQEDAAKKRSGKGGRMRFRY